MQKITNCRILRRKKNLKTLKNKFTKFNKYKNEKSLWGKEKDSAMSQFALFYIKFTTKFSTLKSLNFLFI